MISKGYGTVSMQVLSWNLYSGWYNSLHVPSVVTVQIEMGVRGLNLEMISAFNPFRKRCLEMGTDVETYAKALSSTH